MKYLGIDWATDKHNVALLDEAGAVIDERQVRHQADSVAELLREMAQQGGPAVVKVGIEAGAPLVTDQFLQAGYSVYVLNPKQADRYRDRHTVAGSKDDRLDAVVIADAVRTDAHRLQVLEPDSELTQELRLRDRARSRLVQQRTRYTNQLRRTLQRYYPALLELKRDLYEPFFLELIKAYPDPEAGRRARKPRLQRLLREHRIQVLDADRLSQRLRGEPFWVSGAVMAACRDEALDLVAQIELLNEQIKASERRLRELFKEHPDRELLESLPGLGDVLTIRVAAELGEHRAHNGDASSAQAYAGTAPVTRRSGKGRVSVRMRRGCNRQLQSAMYHMARCSVRKSEWAASYLRHLKGRGVSRAKAVRSLSNKWMKIVVATLSTQKSYDEALHVQHLRRNQVPWVSQPHAAQQRAA